MPTKFSHFRNIFKFDFTYPLKYPLNLLLILKKCETVCLRVTLPFHPYLFFNPAGRTQNTHMHLRLSPLSPGERVAEGWRIRYHVWTLRQTRVQIPGGTFDWIQTVNRPHNAHFWNQKKEILWLLLICLEEKYLKILKSSSGAGEKFIWQMVFVLCQFLSWLILLWIRPSIDWWLRWTLLKTNRLFGF